MYKSQNKNNELSVHPSKYPIILQPPPPGHHKVFRAHLSSDVILPEVIRTVMGDDPVMVLEGPHSSCGSYPLSLMDVAFRKIMGQYNLILHNMFGDPSPLLSPVLYA